MAIELGYGVNIRKISTTWLPVLNKIKFQSRINYQIESLIHSATFRSEFSDEIDELVCDLYSLNDGEKKLF